MSEYKVSNCPSFVLMRTATSGTYFDMCGNAKGHIKCADCIDCVIKQIITICKQYKMSKEDMKRSKESTDIIRGSKYGSDALAIQILQLLDIEEVK